LKTIRILIFLLFPLVILVSWEKENIFVSKEKSQKISIGIGTIKIPLSWQNKTVDNIQYLIDGKDTLCFAEQLLTSTERLCLKDTMDFYQRDVLDGYVVLKDTSSKTEIKKYKKYNDSIAKINPEIKTQCLDFFSPKKISFVLTYQYPCKSETGHIYASIIPQNLNVPCREMRSTKVSPTRALEIIEILKTFQPSK
jgi:hypothetical protein